VAAAHSPEPTLAAADLAAYLDRIGVAAARHGDRHGLARLHRAHVRNIPFENLDIHLDRPLDLDIDHLVQKLVHDHRGGFCYEHNLMLAAALRACGFEVKLLQAQVHDGHTFGPPFDHMALEVTTGDGPILADAGFGQCFQLPIAMDGSAQAQPDGWSYRLERDADAWMLFGLPPGGDETIAYRLDPTARRPAEYDEMCRFHQTSPESHFTRGWVASLATADGRKTLKPGTLIETRHGERTETAVTSLAATQALLRDAFAMTEFELPADFQWARPRSATGPASGDDESCPDTC